MRKRAAQKVPEQAEEFSPELKREMKKRLSDADNPVRYCVYSDIIGNGRWLLWLDVSSDGYGMSIEQATLFKREHVARAAAKAYSEGRRSNLLIAKITTKNGKRRVLKYEKTKHRTTASRQICKRRTRGRAR